MDTTKQPKLFLKAFEHWGMDAQVRKFQEECCELGAAVHQYFEENAMGAMLSEIADVTIMIGQMRIVFGEEIIDAAYDPVFSDAIEKTAVAQFLRSMQAACCRCGAAVNHFFSDYRPQDDTRAALIREISAVEICVRQARILWWYHIDKAVVAKLLRLGALLESERSK
jgi:NTP pyrophosphatase (non-canonical NTP hydrolase)